MEKIKKDTGYKDRKGNPIMVGDIVVFYYDWKRGASNKSKKGKFSKMVDIIYEEEGDFYMISSIGSGAYIWRYNNYCKVIGNVWDNSDLLIEENFDKNWIAESFKIKSL